MERAESSAANRLVAAGERVTRQRVLVAETLSSSGRQLTADELYGRLRNQTPRIGRATVFRTLEKLVAAGVARRLEREGHVYAYVSCAADHHHHLSCTSCGRVEDIAETYVSSVSRRIAREKGFEIEDATLDFYGRCASCRARSGATPS